jgi:hypothetical protein
VQCPEIFVTDAEGLADVPIRLPLQKLVEQIGLTMPAARPVSHTAPIFTSEALVRGDSGRSAESDSARHGGARPHVSESQSFHKRCHAGACRDEEIHLSLAAILRRCPRKSLSGRCHG